ncbi:MAG: ECF transporter S component [Lachnospiraceae bacterium]|nr:ECF transporter S component [Lachnospiraceae bacterium]
MLVLKNRNQKIAVSAMFAAICCVATMIIRIPTFGTNGYVNIGDAVVLLCAWLIGGAYGMLAAGIGSALADLLAGYASYVPGTFVIKALMAIAAYLIFRVLSNTKINKTVAFVISGLVAETVMVAGYFLYEAFALGYGLAAAASIPSNISQGATCLVLGVIVVRVMESNRVLKKINVIQ